MKESSESTIELRKEAVQRLHEAHRDIIQSVAQRVGNQKKAVEAIRGCLKDGAHMVAGPVEQTGMDSASVPWLVATLEEYGEIVEGEKDGTYFRYEANQPAAGSASDSPGHFLFVRKGRQTIQNSEHPFRHGIRSRPWPCRT